MESDTLPLTTHPLPARLSKSKFLAGLQCLKRLYLEIHSPQLAAAPDPATQAILEMGTEIGVLARRRFPGGVLVTSGFRQRETALTETAALVNDPSVPAIFEAAFQHDGVVVRVDILERLFQRNGDPGGWRLIEVKSSSRVKEGHFDDLAIQSHVLSGAGLQVQASCLMHLNTTYVYAGQEIDLQDLFIIADVSETVAARRGTITDRIEAMRTSLLQQHPPGVEPGAHCHSPHECRFWNHCTAEKPARWIHYLPGSKGIVSQLVGRGIQTIDEIPDEIALSAVQRRVKINTEWTSDKLAEVLSTIRYPVHHLDFETVMLAVPRFASTRPYQAIPFQWSNHIEHESGEVIHQQYLHQDAGEPRQQWAEALLESLGGHGSICVYSSYEQAIMEQLAEAFPQYRTAFRHIIKRLWDLLPVIRDHYYHPGFGGSYSMKSVLPALSPALAYGDLAIQDGGHAASAYYRMVFVETDWIEQASLRDALLQYCARDTMAMVQLRRVLAAKAGLLHPPVR